MIHRTMTKATTRKTVPTIQCFVQKHAPEARKMSVAAINDCNPAQHCTRNWIGVVS